MSLSKPISLLKALLSFSSSTLGSF